jgi:hypothetical protein
MNKEAERRADFDKHLVRVHLHARTCVRTVLTHTHSRSFSRSRLDLPELPELALTLATAPPRPTEEPPARPERPTPLPDLAALTKQLVGGEGADLALAGVVSI